jgi:hypothetical protein
MGTVQLAAPSPVEATKEPLGFGMRWGLRVYGGGGLAGVDLRVRVWGVGGSPAIEGG